MDTGHIIIYSISIGAGTLAGPCIAVLHKAYTKGNETMMRMRNREFLPWAAAGALLGAAYGYALTTPPARPHDDSMSMRAPATQDAPAVREMQIALV